MAEMKIKTKRTGRVQAANLDHDSLTFIGKAMVDAQKERWSQAINAEGNPAKKLSVRYAIIKGKFLHTNRPKRDMVMTGETRANFQLRKAVNGVIRAENTTREARRKARVAQGFDEMIGLSGDDQIKIFEASKAQFGKWLRKAWVPVG